MRHRPRRTLLGAFHHFIALHLASLPGRDRFRRALTISSFIPLAIARFSSRDEPPAASPASQGAGDS